MANRKNINRIVPIKEKHLQCILSLISTSNNLPNKHFSNNSQNSLIEKTFKEMENLTKITKEISAKFSNNLTKKLHVFLLLFCLNLFLITQLQYMV